MGRPDSWPSKSKEPTAVDGKYLRRIALLPECVQALSCSRPCRLKCNLIHGVDIVHVFTAVLGKEP